MSRFKKLLIKSLEYQLKLEELALLPSSYQILGEVLIIKLNKELWGHRKSICEKILELNKVAKAVFILGEIEGEYRNPKILYNFGINIVETIHKENGIIHYECLLNDDEKIRQKEIYEILEEINEKAGKQRKKIKLLSVNYVKDYAPHIEHCVLDLEVN